MKYFAVNIWRITISDAVWLYYKVNCLRSVLNLRLSRQLKTIKMYKMLILALLFTLIVSIQTHSHWITNQFVSDINAKAKTWKARINLFNNFTEEELRNLANVLGYHPDEKYVYSLHKYNYRKSDNIPAHFDARERWPACRSISMIRNQRKCGASWAFAAVEVMSDRLCIASNNIVDFTFSPEELINCCTTCGTGCKGGYIFPPFKYWTEVGIPSGGDEDRDMGCKPFTNGSDKRPACIKKCIDGYDKTWQEDIRHGVAAYRVHKSEKQIQLEIMNFGPVVAVMDIYADFYVYGEGVYEHVSWDLVGRMAVKIIGWGEENEIRYWLAANSWGKTFGDNGYVKILRGSNHCGIEYEVTAGTPNTHTE